MQPIIREVKDKHDLRLYIYLPQLLYQNFPNWVPPIYADEWNFHDPSQNKAYRHAEVIRFLAFQDEKPIGRIMGIIHHAYNEAHQEKTGRFFQLDCIPDQEVAQALISTIEGWARSKGMNKVIGPFGFSEKDPQGLQIEGFEHLPVIATPTNPAYLPRLVEAAGYLKEVDCVSYVMKLTNGLPVSFERVYNRIRQNLKLRLIEFTSKRHLKPYIVPVFRLVNETYKSLFGFVPMSEDEMKKFAAQYLPILDPHFVKIVTNEHDEIVAFVVSMPDMSQGIQRAKGKLFPFGFIHILRSAKKTKQLDLLLGAIKPEYRGKGITVLMGKALISTALQHGMETMDSHLILETNIRMRNECENIGGIVYKRYRVFQKNL
ncbi:MAG: GNAT family N-acetyltransferase [Cyclobacteriaceae bacterium]|nr:GNAT family N-acetyltransferase [Cyclobacteriaceae bacterium]